MQQLPDRYHYRRIALPELLKTFLMLGFLGFGGPAAHIALMERELVARREWLNRAYFLDLLAAINLVPGPNSTELALYIGWVVGGVWGFLAAGLGFIGPAVVLSIGLAMLYTAFGSLPTINGILDGIKPVVLVLILSAAYRLGQKAIDNTAMRVLLALALVAVAASNAPLMSLIGASPLRVPELALLLVIGALYVIYKSRRTRAVVAMGPLFGALGHMTLLAARVPRLFDLFGQFFIIGATLFGSGYLLVAYMQRTFVDGLGWMTPQQLLDTLAIGQSTPGPVSSTVSAAGYILTVQPGNIWSGIPGALAATVGVFLPAFIVVAILGKVVPYMRRYPVTLDFLKGVNAGVIALLAGAFVSLAASTLIRPGSGVEWLALAITVMAFIALERLKWSPLLLIALGAVIGLARNLL